MTLYHFCAMRQGECAGALVYSSGTLSSSADISDPVEYNKIKVAIEKQMSNGGEVIILSLSVINRENT